MDYRTATIETLKKIEAEALASLARTGSANLHRTRLAVLGAVSAEMARR